MITKKTRYLVGGGVHTGLRNDILRAAPWFSAKCTRLIDTVITLIPYLAKQDIKKADELLEYIFDEMEMHKLPPAPESFFTSTVAPIRLYAIIMHSRSFYKNAASYILDHIKIENKFIVIKDTHGQGDSI